MAKILRFIEGRFGFFFVGGAAFGFLFPHLFTLIHEGPAYFLMVTLFVSFLKIDLEKLKYARTYWRQLIWATILYMLILPIAFLALFPDQYGDLQAGLFLIIAISAGVSGPFICSILKLNIVWPTLLTVLTSLLVPFILPFLSEYFLHTTLEIDTWGMLLFLIKMILVPFLAATFLKKGLPIVTQKILPYGSTIGTICMSLMVAAIFSKNNPILAEKLWTMDFLIGLGGVIAAFLLLFYFGYIGLGKKTDITLRLSNSISFGVNNIGLAAVLANQFFGPEVIFFTIMGVIPWTAAPLFFSPWVKKKLIGLP